MKHLIIIFLLAIFLMGCESSVKKAKANAIRQSTHRANDRHDLVMADRKALTPIRLFVKSGLWIALLAGGAILLLGVPASASYYLLGTARNRVMFHRIALDVETRQYPLLIYGNGRRIFNPNNGERLLLSDVSQADVKRIESTARVQLAGLITDNAKIING